MVEMTMFFCMERCLFLPSWHLKMIAALVSSIGLHVDLWMIYHQESTNNMSRSTNKFIMPRVLLNGETRCIASIVFWLCLSMLVCAVDYGCTWWVERKNEMEENTDENGMILLDILIWNNQICELMSSWLVFYE